MRVLYEPFCFIAPQFYYRNHFCEVLVISGYLHQITNSKKIVRTFSIQLSRHQLLTYFLLLILIMVLQCYQLSHPQLSTYFLILSYTHPIFTLSLTFSILACFLKIYHQLSQHQLLTYFLILNTFSYFLILSQS